jgi:DNA-binding CsgD family transcriptional regulator
MRPKDVLECVEIIGAHPVFGPRYQNRMAELRRAWLRLLDCDAKTAIVFEEADGSSPRIWGFGVSVFVRDEFIQELKTPPLVWIGPELAKRVAGDNSPILTYDELRQANASDGLNLLVWDGCIRHTVKNESEGYNKMMAYFMGEHRGYRWKEVISLQSPHAEWLGAILRSGGLYWEPASGRWVDLPQKPLEEIVRAPHVTGLSRDPGTRRPGAWADSLFDYQPPRVGFTRSEQRLLLLALDGGTDEELSNDLGVSLSTVKMTWRAIYNRVATTLPALIPSPSQHGSSTGSRGKVKKQRITAYLREHPEELRPTVRKLIQNNR